MSHAPAMLPLRIHVYYMKKNFTTLIVNAVEGSGLEYKVLNVLNGKPQHIRIDGFGDVYPSTATWLDKHGDWHRKDLNGFIRAIDAVKINNTDDDLVKRVTDLEEYCAHLEDEIEKLKLYVKF